MHTVVSWSGGKDGCFACYKAISDGFDVTHLLNFTSKEGRCMSHGLDSKLIAAQSQMIGIPIIQREVTWETYEQGFKSAMHKLKQEGVEGAVFGDIAIQEHRDWVDRVCRELDIAPILPLWGIDEEKILSEFINEKFEAIIVNVKADLFDKKWLGRKVDRGLLSDLKELMAEANIHICGELGEYHTFVTDEPLFKKSLKILDGVEILKSGYWFLDISKYEVVEKPFSEGGGCLESNPA